MENNKLYDMIDGARFIHVDNGTVYAWRGGLTINLYDVNGDNFNCFTVNQRLYSVDDKIAYVNNAIIDWIADND